MRVLERDNAFLLGYPALREDSKPYLGRSSKYPEGVRENGMYCHGVQWMVRASRILAERFDKEGDFAEVSIYLVPDGGFVSQGRNLLLSAERWLKENRPDINGIRASVLCNNEVSKNLFLRSNYHIHSICYQK